MPKPRTFLASASILLLATPALASSPSATALELACRRPNDPDAQVVYALTMGFVAKTDAQAIVAGSARYFGPPGSAPFKGPLNGTAVKRLRPLSYELNLQLGYAPTFRVAMNYQPGMPAQASIRIQNQAPEAFICE